MPLTTQVDTDNQFAWDTRVQEFDDNGVLVASNIIYDSGIEISRTYAMSEGEYSYNHIVTELRIDHNDVTGWTTIFPSKDLVTYNEVQQVTQFDDGRVRTAESVRSSGNRHRGHAPSLLKHGPNYSYTKDRTLSERNLFSCNWPSARTL